MDALLKKLGGMFQKQNASWIEVDFSRWGMGHRDSVKFERLKTALIGRRALSIHYCSTSGETSHRVILPVKLIFKDKGWYLLAFCRMQEDYRLFKVNRIVELEVLEERFSELPDEIPPLEQNADMPTATEEMRLLFAPALAFRVYDEFDRSMIQRMEDGSLLVRVQLPQNGWVVGYLLSYGTQLTVLEPESLRMQIALFAKAIWQQHEKEPESFKKT